MISGRIQPSLYVVTVNYESPHRVENLVRSLEQCGIVKKLVVVDHSSHSFYEPKESTFPIQVIRQTNRGYGAGINRGLREINDPEGIAFVCNPDIEIVTPDTMIDAVQALTKNPHWACLVPAQIDRVSNRIFICRKFYTWKSLIQSRIGFMRRNPHIYRREHFYMDKNLDQSFDVDWGGGSSLFLSLGLFPHPLSFDERFFLYFEDVDLGVQARLHGYSVRYYPNVVIRHHEQRQSHKSLYFFGIHFQSLIRFILKYRGLPQADDAHEVQPVPVCEKFSEPELVLIRKRES